MQVLIKDKSMEVPLDYATGGDEQRINVQLVINVSPIKSAYFQRKKDWRLVWNYIQEIGIKNTLNKIVSRSAESWRNEKYLSVGYGYVDTNHGSRQYAFFIAPLHPACVDKISCHTDLIFFTDEILDLPPDNILYISTSKNTSRTRLLEACGELAGWTSYSGKQVSRIDWNTIVSLTKELLVSVSATKLAAPTRSAITVSEGHPEKQQRFSATLFGYGNYAKTVILPNLPPQIRITRIHEIDPLQFGKKTHLQYQCSTEPTLSKDDQNSVLFIAGYHHTHADLAVAGLGHDRNVVVEKPLVTSREQLVRLQSAYENSNGRYFACFHKRYLSFNQRIRTDLGVGPSEPVNYHAIVYEVPLPALHWYRWPNSCSRIVSNGCHWMDHFLFLNNFSPVANYSASSAPDGTINVSVALKNDACFTMVLTDKGSERLGVQDYIELRQNQTTIKMTNGAHYQAEDSQRILVRLSCNRMESYRNMYRSIGNRIANAEAGDSWQSIFISSNLTLDIEALLIDTMPHTLRRQLAQQN